MLKSHLKGRGIGVERVLAAFAAVPREALVLASDIRHAYDDRPLDIGFGVTISQPYIVARTVEAARIAPGDKVLEIGTGSGYQTAILSELGAQVATIEIIPELSARAKSRLSDLGYRNIRYLVGDGHDGWPGDETFDAILLSAAPRKICDKLLSQLAVGGRLVGPEGEEHGPQWLARITQTPGGFFRERLEAVKFVPMIGGNSVDSSETEP